MEKWASYVTLRYKSGILWDLNILVGILVLADFPVWGVGLGLESGGGVVLGGLGLIT